LRKPVADQPVSTPARQKQQRVSLQPTPRTEPPTASAASRYLDGSPESPVANYNRRPDDRNNSRAPGEWEEAHPLEQFRPSLSPNQYSSPAAPQHTPPLPPPPPPPRPAKVPTPGPPGGSMVLRARSSR
jgi:hypothetical protein